MQLLATCPIKVEIWKAKELLEELYTQLVSLASY